MGCRFCIVLEPYLRDRIHKKDGLADLKAHPSSFGSPCPVLTSKESQPSEPLKGLLQHPQPRAEVTTAQYLPQFGTFRCRWREPSTASRVCRVSWVRALSPKSTGGSRARRGLPVMGQRLWRAWKGTGSYEIGDFDTGLTITDARIYRESSEPHRDNMPPPFCGPPCQVANA